MSTNTFRTTPHDTDRMPPGIPYIVGNEVAERFSFYGMRGILVPYMTKHLAESGAAANLSEPEAKAIYHLFVAMAYFFPMFGALLADSWWGKYRTILTLSWGYCLGHLALAVLPGLTGLYAGLVLIALGAGGIKPCVSAHVGDQFGTRNEHLLERVFGWFYFAINFGAFFSSLLIPWLLDNYGPHVAFGVPGVLMFVATVIFWMGRHQFVHVPANPQKFLADVSDKAGQWAVLRLLPIYAMVSVFWCLFDQTSSAWVLQANKMDLNFAGIVWNPAQVQALNPLFVMGLIPLCNFVLYPALANIISLTPLRKMAIGMFLAVIPFAVSAMVEHRISLGEQPNVQWHVWAFVVITVAEVMVSITGLEFSYTQAPKSAKSLVMSAWLLSVWLGNMLASGVNVFISRNQDALWLQGANYYWFFSGLMLMAAFGFAVLAVMFREKGPSEHNSSANQ